MISYGGCRNRVLCIFIIRWTVFLLVPFVPAISSGLGILSINKGPRFNQKSIIVDIADSLVSTRGTWMEDFEAYPDMSASLPASYEYHTLWSKKMGSDKR